MRYPHCDALLLHSSGGSLRGVEGVRGGVGGSLRGVEGVTGGVGGSTISHHGTAGATRIVTQEEEDRCLYKVAPRLCLPSTSKFQ